MAEMIYKGIPLLSRSDIEEITGLVRVAIEPLGLPQEHNLDHFVACHWPSLKKSRTARQFMQGAQRLAYRYERKINV